MKQSRNTHWKKPLPCSSINLRAFSKKEGVPSASSKASKIGLPTTKDFTGCLLLTRTEIQKINHPNETPKQTDQFGKPQMINIK